MGKLCLRVFNLRSVERQGLLFNAFWKQIFQSGLSQESLGSFQSLFNFCQVPADLVNIYSSWKRQWIPTFSLTESCCAFHTSNAAHISSKVDMLEWLCHILPSFFDTPCKPDRLLQEVAEVGQKSRYERC